VQNDSQEFLSIAATLVLVARVSLGMTSCYFGEAAWFYATVERQLKI
jgi:hypothetical protein